MAVPGQQERMESALGESDPSHALWSLAKAFKAEGMTQLDMYNLFNSFRAKHEDDADETKHDAILDTMDLIVGYCRSDVRLFEKDLKEAWGSESEKD